MKNPAYSLVELLAALAILGVLLAVAVPPAGRWRDAAAVRAARDELAAALAWTRTAAVAGGGAVLVLDPVSATFWTEHPEHRTTPVDLGHRYGVEIDAGTTTLVTFRYDALGIGRLANRTVRLHRSRAAGGITVSSFGRVRRW